MELWQQILAAGMGVIFLFLIFPSIKPAMERSKNAEEKHWGTILLLAIALIAFIVFLVSTVQ
jgi:amino acid transporter